MINAWDDEVTPVLWTLWMSSAVICCSVSDDSFCLNLRLSERDTHKHQFTSFCWTVSHKHRLSGSLLNILNADFQKIGLIFCEPSGKQDLAYFSQFLPATPETVEEDNVPSERREADDLIHLKLLFTKHLMEGRRSLTNIKREGLYIQFKNQRWKWSVRFAPQPGVISASLQQRNYDKIIT